MINRTTGVAGSPAFNDLASKLVAAGLVSGSDDIAAIDAKAKEICMDIPDAADESTSQDLYEAADAYVDNYIASKNTTASNDLLFAGQGAPSTPQVDPTNTLSSSKKQFVDPLNNAAQLDAIKAVLSKDAALFGLNQGDNGAVIDALVIERPGYEDSDYPENMIVKTSEAKIREYANKCIDETNKQICEELAKGTEVPVAVHHSEAPNKVIGFIVSYYDSESGNKVEKRTVTKDEMMGILATKCGGYIDTNKATGLGAKIAFAEPQSNQMGTAAGSARQKKPQIVISGKGEAIKTNNSSAIVYSCVKSATEKKPTIIRTEKSFKIKRKTTEERRRQLQLQHKENIDEVEATVRLTGTADMPTFIRTDEMKPIFGEYSARGFGGISEKDKANAFTIAARSLAYMSYSDVAVGVEFMKKVNGEVASKVGDSNDIA